MVSDHRLYDAISITYFTEQNYRTGGQISGCQELENWDSDVEGKMHVVMKGQHGGSL